MKIKPLLLTIALIVLSIACHKTLTHQAVGEKFTLNYEVNRSEKEIQAFEKADAAIGLHKLQGQIVFYGSSSIRLWKTLKEDFAPLPVINHGFGGSTFPEMTYYANRMLVPYKPKIIVLYCENDLFSGKEKTPEQLFDAFAELATLIQNKLPKTKVYYISMKPSISRKDKWNLTTTADALIRAYIDKHKNFSFVDIRPVMYAPNGKVNGEYFIKDSLHMTPKGYAQWTSVVRPILLKNYK
ncbi:GDSL-type esterase/lipase family protein [Emticicia sp. 21SJ11W-3]|uniref:GDSL-type esterase/lipase family protein n=1 Tax=Emticicia sp. 21SJ11W-3 TaxID=2916755 RepID=UPI0020A148DD|nr:GDSL-type esterase/lipase family protein [Emticicia sp. 21SJ11W-3]UTA68281.1 GDSL-type esterase/lipase family protein [Emticicia sp. 21SJ11W-3]